MEVWKRISVSGGKEGAEEMIRVVCLEDEVKAMESGIHTLVGTGGVRLSGGQAQRLALARTLYHKRPVLVLDDPFSALDKETEAQIFLNLKELDKRLYYNPHFPSPLSVQPDGSGHLDG